MIFSKTTCFYCEKAKKLFEHMNVNYTAVELDLNENGNQIQDVLEQMTGGRTVSILLACNKKSKNLNYVFRGLWTYQGLQSSEMGKLVMQASK